MEEDKYPFISLTIHKLLSVYINKQINDGTVEEMQRYLDLYFNQNYTIKKSIFRVENQGEGKIDIIFLKYNDDEFWDNFENLLKSEYRNIQIDDVINN